MPHLPRVSAFPIAAERSIITAAGAALHIPAKEKASPLIGQLAPEIVAQDHLGREVSLHSTISLGRPIVLYFFPLAGSPHCTKESCSFRDAVGTSPVFNDLNAVVIGISQDPPSRSRRFVDEHHLGFRILHDENRQIMDAWGVGRGLMGLIDGRCTFIIDQDGVVRAMLDGVWDYKGHRDFAEKWLCRIEHELSGRERFYVEHEADESVACDEMTRNVRVVYGEVVPGRGIATAPRFGAAPAATKGKSSKSTTAESSAIARSSSAEGEKVPRMKSRRNLRNWLRPGGVTYDEPLHVDSRVNRSADDFQQRGADRVGARSVDKASRVRSGMSADHASVIARDFAELGLRSRQGSGSGSGYATPSTISARSVSTGETSHTSPGLEHATKLAAAIKSGIANPELERSGSARRRDTGTVRPTRSSSLLKKAETTTDTDAKVDGMVYANGNIAKMPLLPSGERSTDSKAATRGGGPSGHSGDSSIGSTNGSSLPVPPRARAVAAAASARLSAHSASRPADDDEGYDTDRATSTPMKTSLSNGPCPRALPPQSPALSYAPPTLPSSWSTPHTRRPSTQTLDSPSLDRNGPFFTHRPSLDPAASISGDRRLSATPSLTPSQISTSMAGSEYEYSPSLNGSTHTFGGLED
ncbi:Alkyl hydroperoxide reductase subunit C/ Thiol specific antioxidant [Kalmanozyma brasiliensis GHG001]|uniref:thioredoxin-dependent peroxiredoxin n=1 Tax=Kalmanozyma brasiliensis (strain GHG001) TaxID=1365824 RepID=V5E4F1_KALBG|nr:Alkyl hydroperoxide reductase subunit C/ Thiol specific antioxidant [Kalmanozyma brasiliensis GHG001]EST05041.1 Alkyl hydroperoxide reductase subunit C/ Thiol specific antioxidant [Kalmanozyma brasiliensis GHG001]